MGKGIKAIIWAVVVAVLLLTVASMVYAPVTPLGKEGQCERELGRIRGILRGGGVVMGRDFVEWQACSGYSLDAKPICAQIGEYCKEFSARIGEDVFTIGSVGGYDCVLDPWGNAYHVGTLDDIKGFDVRNVKMAKLKTFMVGEWVLWSCGPNGVNDRGGGDDVLEFKMRWVAN